jgi:hypothetical protein
MSKNSENPKVASSPERHTFQAEGAKKRAEEKGEEVPEFYLEFWKTAKQQDEDNLVDPKWQRNNLEYDLRSTDWILAKANASDSYAQNIYAALCNMQWCNVKGDDPAVTLEILKENYWSCSWRHAGGIVADMLQRGDYIDWYCSGIRHDDGDISNRYVPEGQVTEEIRGDFATLGWVPIPWDDDN